MLSDFFLNNLWASIALWLLLSITDSILTVAGAKLYHSGVKKHFLFSGSYELEPFHQSDVDRFKVVSFGFMLSLILYGGLIWIIYSTGFKNLFALAWGGLIFMQVVVHMRHFHNLLLFSFVSRSRGIDGQVKYERWLSLCLSGSDFLGYSLLLTTVWLFTNSLVVLGGAVACALMAVRHWVMSMKNGSKEEMPDTSRA